MEKFIVQKEMKLSDFLIESYKGQLGFMKLKKLFSKKEIKLNAQRVKEDCLVKKGDVVECYYDKESLKIEVIYKDENILLCIKPQGITSEDFFNEVKSQHIGAIFTHRLDRNTSGIMVFALNEEAYEELFKGFKERTFEKYYHCLVNGAFDKKQGTLSDFIFKDAKKGMVKVYSQKKVGCLPAVTKYWEVKRGEYSSVLKVLLVTGRTHQIRAHLAFHGHFIIGDGKYGNEKVNNFFKVHSQLLFASEIIFHFKKDEKLFYLNNKNFSVSYDKVYEFLK